MNRLKKYQINLINLSKSFVFPIIDCVLSRILATKADFIVLKPFGFDSFLPFFLVKSLGFEASFKFVYKPKDKEWNSWKDIDANDEVIAIQPNIKFDFWCLWKIFILISAIIRVHGLACQIFYFDYIFNIFTTFFREYIFQFNIAVCSIVHVAPILFTFPVEWMCKYCLVLIICLPAICYEKVEANKQNIVDNMMYRHPSLFIDISMSRAAAGRMWIKYVTLYRQFCSSLLFFTK